MSARRALVTGASSGIGAAYAERLAADGVDLVLVARRRDRLEELAGRLDAEVRVVEADLGRPEGLDAVREAALDAPVDVLVNNAALAHYGPFADLDPDAAHQLVELNVLAPVLLTRAVLPGMIERGSGGVVNVASLLAFSGEWDGPHLPRRAVYAATKSFLLTFTQVLAGELADSGVRVQVLCPGVVRTEFHSRQGMDMTGRTRMEPKDVVAASLADLERGVIVSIPGLEDEHALADLAEAEAALAASTGAVVPASRYRRA
ncbi:MAG: SDR family NAD(P)-dependent oxidoreductase [Gaiellaceae bacterium]